MATGLGLKGTTSRCFFHFQDFTVCMKTDDEPMKHCGILRDDYLECLHKLKEKTRNKEIDAEAKRQAAAVLSGKSDSPVGHGGGGGH